MKQAAIALPVLVALLFGPIVGAGLVVAVLVPSSVAATSCTGPVAAAAGSWRSPMVARYTVTSQFGPRFHPVLGVRKVHTGIDLVAAGADKTIVAAAGGTVDEAGFNTAYGNQVIIDHGGGIQTRYAHMAAPSDVRAGARVEAGTRLGVQGATGYVTGAHLHFEVIQAGRPVDPKPFMAGRGAPLNGRAVAITASTSDLADQLGPEAAAGEGGVGFDLPAAGEPRQASLKTPPAPIPAAVKKLYVAAGAKYRVPWTLLAGIGMEETAHGRNTAVSSAGAQGPMQFMPATFATVGVDGDGDGDTDIDSPADAIYSAANYLTKSGVTRGGADGVRKALFAYNHADWYVNDVLHYAHAYGGGTVLGGVEDCGPGTGTGDPDAPPLTDERVRAVLAFADAQAGDAYVMGATGPGAWDCSSLVQAVYAKARIRLPRTAQAQRDWLANGHGTRIKPGTERPGDLIFWDSYRGPNQIGHVVLVREPTKKQTTEARNRADGVGHFTYTPAGKNLFEIWRPANLR